jgi:hypothetical protein
VRHVDPFAFWDRYFRTHDETPDQLQESLAYLFRANKWDHIEAAVQAYLRYHPESAEPRMYEALAMAMEANKRGESAVKQALGYAAFQAKKSKNPDELLRAADLLYLRGYNAPFEVKVRDEKEKVGVGPLVDLAAEVAPYLPEPLMMSVNLAQKTHDPGRMANAVEAILSLGWPNIDDAMRLQAQREVEKLASALRQADREADATKLTNRFAEADNRDVFVRLTWKGDADLDLAVDEPLGALASHQIRRTVFGGALVKEGHGGKHAEEVYVCPRGFDGKYTIRVLTIYNNPDEPVDTATLEIITHEGMASEHKETRTLKLPKPDPIVVTLTDGRRKMVLPFFATVTVKPKPAKPKKKTEAAPEVPKPSAPTPSASPSTAPAPKRALPARPAPPPGPQPIDPGASPDGARRPGVR